MDVVVILKENRGQSLVVVAGSEVVEEDVSWEIELTSDVLDSAEEVVSDVVEVVDADVSDELDAVAELETVSKVVVDVG